jgi:hypothetical protein
MQDFIIEDKKIIDINQKNNIKDLLPSIPFFYSKISTTKKFPYYSHCLIQRPQFDKIFNSSTSIQISSPYFDFFYKIVDQFCYKHNIKYSNLIRCNINSTYYIPNYPYVDPHVDFSKPHIVILIYLNKISKSSPTLIFNKTQKFDNKNVFLDVSNFKNKSLKIKKKIYPEFGKIVAFDGKYYHSNKFPKPGENRIVCVFNLLI